MENDRNHGIFCVLSLVFVCLFMEREWKTKAFERILKLFFCCIKSGILYAVKREPQKGGIVMLIFINAAWKYEK